MTERYYTKLLTRIREKCQRQQWFGPDMDAPARLQSYLGADGQGSFSWYDEQDQPYSITRETDIQALPIPTTFVESPATAEQLRETETELGFALPTLLREIYTHVANGGFGPGYGLDGILGGFGSMVSMGNMVGSYNATKWQTRQVDIADFEHRVTSENVIVVPDYLWPERFIELCDWGCMMYSYLDVVHNRVFREYSMSATEGAYGFELEAPSLEAWWELWLNTAL